MSAETEIPLTQQAIDAFYKAEKQTIAKVLEQILERKPTRKDFRKCTLSKILISADYELLRFSFDRIEYGTIKRLFSPGKVRIEFNPC